MIHVMVIDDNEMNLTLLLKILELEGYRVSIGHDGKDAIRNCLQDMPDLAILDVMMPDMNGFELCRKMRQPPVNANIPIVLLTAMNSEMEREQALAAGANDIWSKPFDLDIFRKKVGQLVKKNGS